MAERQASPRKAASTVKVAGAAAKPKRRQIRAGGHVIEADPVPETPAESVSCSVCGGDPKRCPHGNARGWTVEG